jgi:hypothetical protein
MNLQVAIKMKHVLDGLITLCKSGTKENIDAVMAQLNMDITIAMSKIIDYSLSFVESEEGVSRMMYYLFHGTQMQRNYCTLYFNRRGDWPIVRSAYEQGLIDYIQAYSR